MKNAIKSRNAKKFAHGLSDVYIFQRYQLTICAATALYAKRRASEFVNLDSKLMSNLDDSESPDSALSEFESSVEIAGGEKTSHAFTKLPEIVGSGFPYIVQVRVIATSPREVSCCCC